MTMIRERHKQIYCKANNTDALHRGGQACSSDEVTVMVMERRGLATMLISNGQLIKQEEPSEINKTVCNT